MCIHLVVTHGSGDGVPQNTEEVLVEEVVRVSCQVAPPHRPLAPFVDQVAGGCPSCGTGMHHMHYAPDGRGREKRKGRAHPKHVQTGHRIDLALVADSCLPTPAVTSSAPATQMVNSPSGMALLLSPRLQSLPWCSKKYATLPRVVLPSPRFPARWSSALRYIWTSLPRDAADRTQVGVPASLTGPPRMEPVPNG